MQTCNVSAFYASSVQLGTHSRMWLHCIHTCELAPTKRTRYNTTNTCLRMSTCVGCVVLYRVRLVRASSRVQIRCSHMCGMCTKLH